MIHDYTSFSIPDNNNSGIALHNWVISFLRGPGNNEHLADIVEKIGILPTFSEQDLSKLQRICGPERGMIFHEDECEWQRRVFQIQKKLKEGWQAPPLIVTNYWGDFHISDGSHRHEALLRNGVSVFPVITYSRLTDTQILH